MDHITILHKRVVICILGVDSVCISEYNYTITNLHYKCYTISVIYLNIN